MDVILLKRHEAQQIIDMLTRALDEGREVRLAPRGDRGVSVKVGGGMWTYPLGHLDPGCDKAVRLRETV